MPEPLLCSIVLFIINYLCTIFCCQSSFEILLPYLTLAFSIIKLLTSLLSSKRSLFYFEPNGEALLCLLFKSPYLQILIVCGSSFFSNSYIALGLPPTHSPDIVLVSILSLLNDELSVKQHKATHNHKSNVEISLEEERKPIRQNHSNDTAWPCNLLRSPKWFCVNSRLQYIQSRISS